jgi:Type IV secretory system Conjugative DNA transfer/WD domain, G-beta repeat
MSENLSFTDELPVSAIWLQELLPVAMARCRFRDWVIDGATRTATASRDLSQPGVLVRRETLQLVINWQSSSEELTIVKWSIFDYSQGQRGAENTVSAREFQTALRVVVYSTPEPQKPAHNPCIPPGGEFDGFYSGNLKDYSFCADQIEVGDFLAGVLPLGVHAYGDTDWTNGVWYGSPLYLPNDRTGKPMLYKGVLVCAPQNSGKTALIVRWAKAANAAGYNVLLVDVKGNLYDKLLKDEWRGQIFYLSTAPYQREGEPPSDRTNFLAGYINEPYGITAETSDRIKQLATALLPSEGFTGQGGKDEFFYRNRVIWLTALIHLLLLQQIYYPWKFKDCKHLTDECKTKPGQESQERCESMVCERTVDLSDLYELAVSEQLLLKVIQDLRDAEKHRRSDPNSLMPECGVDYWVREIALLLGPDQGGARPANETYQSFTAGIKQPLEPFARHGTLYRKIRDNGIGRLFKLEDLGVEPPLEPVTILLAAREQDQINSETLLSIVITRLQHLLFDRMPLENPRPILLLLDETRRIRGFEANKYITFAREAKAGCVIVYQSLDQIGDEKKISEILENVGTQIYLGSLVGNTAKYFINILPKRYRPNVSENLQRASSGTTRTQVFGKELVDAFTTNELYRLPAGKYPALVYISDQPRQKPMLVDMDDSIIPNPQIPNEIVLEMQVLYQHSAEISCLMFWPDEQYLAICGIDETIEFIRINDHNVVLSLPSTTSGGQCLDISRDGSLIVTGKHDGRAVLSSGIEGTIIRTFEAHVDEIKSVIFASSEKLIIAGSKDGSITVHEVESGNLIQEIYNHSLSITSIVNSDSKGLILSASLDRTIRFWQIDNSMEVAAIEIGEPVFQLAATDDFSLIALACENNIYIYRFDEQLIQPIAGTLVSPTCISCSANGQVLAVGYLSGHVQVLRVSDWQFAATFTISQQAIKTIALNANGHQVAFSSTGMNVNILDIAILCES